MSVIARTTNVSSLLYTSIADARSTLMCDEANGCRITVEELRMTIVAERRGAQPRKGLILELERGIRVRERLLRGGSA